MSVANGTLRQVKRLLLPLLLAGVMVLLAASGWLWRLDNLLYDLQLGWRGSVAADDIMLVAVDDQSLAEFGRWPWPRERHAQLIEILTRAGARAIVMDLLFAEPDPANPQGDRRLIQAVAASGKVFMPVVVEELQLGGQLLESLPLPQLTEVVAGLGHVHMELDDDGIARGIYLQEGLGEAFWPHLMLTVLQSLEPARFPPAEQPGPATTAAKRFSIVRQGHRLIPFAGPPGHFPRLSYAQVLRGAFHPDSLRDRIVLVGVTATGLGDVLPTPLSGRGQPMAGIEINANILQSLRNGEAVKPLARHWQLLLTGLLVALPLLLYSRLPPRLVPLLALGLILSLLLLSLMVLQFGGIWFAPSAALLGLVLSYPLWSWRRLEQMVLHLDQELQRLSQGPQLLPAPNDLKDLQQGLESIAATLPLQGWCVDDALGARLAQAGRQPDPSDDLLQASCWSRLGRSLWTLLPRGTQYWRLGLCWPPGELPRGRGQALLDDFVRQFSIPPAAASAKGSQRLEQRIREVEAANQHLRQLRDFINTALGQMDDGLLVLDSIGRVVLANPRAAFYLGLTHESELHGQPALTFLKPLQIVGDLHWEPLLRELLLRGDGCRFEALRLPDTELFVQLRPLHPETAGMFGMIVTLSFIGTLKQSERARARMVNFLSHDIRSPLTSLLALTQSEQVLQAGSRELATQVAPYARRALKLAEDFLQLARAESVERSAFTDTDFVSVAHNAVDEVYVQAQARNLRLQRQFEVEEVWLQADAGLLERALINLLSNAIKLAPQDSQVEIMLRCDGDQLDCCVKDRGPGIPQERLEELFLPFRSDLGHEPVGRGGIGLGLNFVKLVAERHGGSIEARNRLEGGASFCLHLPVEV